MNDPPTASTGFGKASRLVISCRDASIRNLIEIEKEPTETLASAGLALFMCRATWEVESESAIFGLSQIELNFERDPECD